MPSRRFGRFEVRPAERALLIDGKPAELGARAFDVLQALIARHGRVVTKDELLDIVWPNLMVEENNLQAQVSALRKLLGPKAIATIPGRGYQFALTEEESSEIISPIAPTLGVARTNVCPQLTPLVGRQEVLADIRRLLDESRLVSLKGAGGIGKTRLAIQTGFDLLDEMTDGVWFVDLAPVRDPAIIAATALRAVGYRAHPGQTAYEALEAFLRSNQALLILDNCEQVVASVAGVCAALLQACARLRILCTSREILNVVGEQVYDVPTLTEAEGVELFVLRAKAVSAEFAVNDKTRPDIVQVVTRLDGISLAIELAAARMRATTVAELASHLDDRFHVLTGSNRAGPSRHQTLRAMLAWSYQLLVEEEKQLFRNLGVFNGVFDLAAAVAVAGDESREEWQVLDLLTQLVDKSMVETDSIGTTQHYRLFESVRAFAWSEFEFAGQTAALRTRHLVWFRKKAEMALVAYQNGDWHMQLPLIQSQYANFRAALEWSLEGETDPGSGIAICITLAPFWDQFGLIDEARYWLACGEKHITLVPAKMQAQLLQAIGRMYANSGEAARGKVVLERSIALSWPLDDAREDWAMACNNLVFVENQRGHLELAKAHAVQALPVCKELKLHSWEYVASNYGVTCLLDGRPEEAERLIREAGARLEIKWGSDAITLCWLAECAFSLRNVEKAIALANDSIEQRRRLGGTYFLARTLVRLSKYLLAQGDLDGACAALNEAAPTFLQNPVYLNELIDNSTIAAVALNQLEQAALLQGYIDAWLVANDFVRPPLRKQEIAPSLKELRASLSKKAFTESYSQGQMLSLAEAIALVQKVVSEHQSAYLTLSSCESTA